MPRYDDQMLLPGCGMTLAEKLHDSIEILRLWEQSALELHPDRGYIGCFSGGKDSIAVKRVAEMAGISVEWVYNVTTIDPPELVRFIRTEHPDVRWNRPKIPFFARIPKKGLPTRVMRWCCAEYKENVGGTGWKITGIRAAESPRRREQWRTVTRWRKGSAETWVVNPILYWSDYDVWEFIRRENLPYCSLYDEGFDRLGCVGCPMARKYRRKEFERWPRYERLWRKAAHALWDRRTTEQPLQRDGREWFGSAKFKNADEMFEWWLSDEPLPKNEDDCGMGLW